MVANYILNGMILQVTIRRVEGISYDTISDFIFRWILHVVFQNGYRYIVLLCIVIFQFPFFAGISQSL